MDYHKRQLAGHTLHPETLMMGFGYDPAHSIVKARQHGLKSVLYKPFRLEQLLTEVEKAVSSPAKPCRRTAGRDISWPGKAEWQQSQRQWLAR